MTAALHPRAARERRQGAFSTAVAAIARSVPNLADLVSQLEVVVGHIAALRARMPARSAVLNVVVAQPDAAVWDAVANGGWR